MQVAGFMSLSVFLLKCAVVGPQKSFARASSSAVCLGLVVLQFSEMQGDAASWAGALLILSGMLIGAWMLVVAIYWLLFQSRYE